MARFTRIARLSIACSVIAALATPVFARVMVAPHQQQMFSEPPPADLEVRNPDDAVHEAVLDRASVRAALVRARAQNLARFRAYRKAGVFPSNTYQGTQLNVWLDEQGHFCAAATIIRASGQVALVDRVAEQNNFIRLATVKQGPLMDWILTSGLTQDELVAIQKPFMPVMREPHVVEPDLRQAEDARLRASYRKVDAMIVRDQKRSLETATDRLMKHPELAWKLVDETANELRTMSTRPPT